MRKLPPNIHAWLVEKLELLLEDYQTSNESTILNTILCILDSAIDSIHNSAFEAHFDSLLGEAQGGLHKPCRDV